MLAGGYLMIRSEQGTPVYEPDGNRPSDARHDPSGRSDHKPPLAVPPLTAQQLAELVAHPALLP